MRDMNILLIQTAFLGDVVLSTPVAKAIKSLYPDSKLTTLTIPAGADVMRACPSVDEVMVYDKRNKQKGFSGLFKMASEIREKSFDVVFSLHKSWRTAALIKLSKIPTSYGFTKAKANFVYTKTAEREDLEHEILRNLAILRTVGKEPSEFEHRMRIEPEETLLKRVDALLDPFSETKVVGVSPGSAWLTKSWTVEGYVETINTLCNYGYGVVILGGPGDVKVCNEIATNCPPTVLNMAGKSTVAELCAVISKLDVLLCNDSAPLHIAAACGTPLVALFCATIPEFGFGPLGVDSKVLGVDGLDCRPCGRHGGNKCPTGTHACRINLASTKVIEACLSFLKQGSAQKIV